MGSAEFDRVKISQFLDHNPESADFTDSADQMLNKHCEGIQGRHISAHINEVLVANLERCCMDTSIYYSTNKTDTLLLLL